MALPFLLVCLVVASLSIDPTLRCATKECDEAPFIKHANGLPYLQFESASKQKCYGPDCAPQQVSGNLSPDRQYNLNYQGGTRPHVLLDEQEDVETITCDGDNVSFKTTRKEWPLGIFLIAFHKSCYADPTGFPQPFYKQVRRVSYSNGVATFETVARAFTDVFHSLKLSAHIDEPVTSIASDLQDLEDKKRISGRANVTLFSREISRTETRTVGSSFIEWGPTINVGVGLGVELNIDTDVSLGGCCDWDWLVVCTCFNLPSIATSIRTFDFHLWGQVSLTNSLELGLRRELTTEFALPDVPLPRVTFVIYAIPFVLNPSLGLSVSIEAMLNVTASVSTTVTGRASAGIRYVNNRFQPYSTFTPSFSYEPPQFNSIRGSLQVALLPRFNVNINGMITFFIKLKPYVDIELQPRALTSDGRCPTGPFVRLGIFTGLQLIGGVSDLTLGFTVGGRTLGFTLDTERSFPPLTVVARRQLATINCNFCGPCPGRPAKRRAIAAPEDDLEWVLGNWSDCSVSCGQGSQSRSVKCFQNNVEVNDDQCDGIPKPLDSQLCQQPPCNSCKDLSCFECSKHTECTYCQNVGCKFVEPGVSRAEACGGDKRQLDCEMKPQLEITYPAPNSRWTQASDFRVSWRGGKAPYVIVRLVGKIDGKTVTYSGGGLPEVLRNTGSFSWTPAGFPSGTVDLYIVDKMDSTNYAYVENIQISSNANRPGASSYFYTTWSKCNVECGGGASSRTPFCLNANGQRVANTSCGVPEDLFRACNTHTCDVAPLEILFSQRRFTTGVPFNFSWHGGQQAGFVKWEFYYDKSVERAGSFIDNFDAPLWSDAPAIFPEISSSIPLNARPVTMYTGPNNGSFIYSFSDLLPSSSGVVVRISSTDIAGEELPNSVPAVFVIGITKMQSFDCEIKFSRSFADNLFMMLHGHLLSNMTINVPAKAAGETYVLKGLKMLDPVSIFALGINSSAVEYVYIHRSDGKNFIFGFSASSSRRRQAESGLIMSPNCADNSNCESCNVDDACGWCSSTSRCLPSSASAHAFSCPAALDHTCTAEQLITGDCPEAAQAAAVASQGGSSGSGLSAGGIAGIAVATFIVGLVLGIIVIYLIMSSSAQNQGTDYSKF